MFDPTAFENLKVVLEGAFYDLDLEGEIKIIDRNDLVNTAKLSRKFELFFQLPQFVHAPITAKLELAADLENLAAELLPGSLTQLCSGCFLHFEFSFEQQNRIMDYEQIEKILADRWGENRTITQAVTFYPLQEDKKWHSVIKLEFNRLIHEDQMDDLISMVDAIITTLSELQSYLDAI